MAFKSAGNVCAARISAAISRAPWASASSVVTEGNVLLKAPSVCEVASAGERLQSSSRVRGSRTVAVTGTVLPSRGGGCGPCLSRTAGLPGFVSMAGRPRCRRLGRACSVPACTTSSPLLSSACPRKRLSTESVCDCACAAASMMRASSAVHSSELLAAMSTTPKAHSGRASGCYGCRANALSRVGSPSHKCAPRTAAASSDMRLLAAAK